MPRLIFRPSGDPADAVQEFELTRGEVVIGRSDDVDVTLDNQTVSRRHAVIARTTQGFVLTDSGSANGTWVNKRRVTDVVLRHGDVISFGTVAAIFDEPPDPNATLMVDIAGLLDDVEPPRVVGSAPSAVTRGDVGRVTDRQTAQGSPAAPPAARRESGPKPSPELVSRPAPAPSPEPSRAEAPPRAAAAAPPPARRPAPPPVAEKKLRPEPRPVPPPPARRPMSTPVRAGGTSAARPARHAGFWIRVVAMLIDSAVIGLASVVLWAGGAALAAVVGGRGSTVGGLLVLATGVVAAALPPLYFVIGWTRSGRTLGKVAFGLRVRREDGGDLTVGTAVVRLLGTMVSSAILGIGYLMVAFTDRKRGLHDMIAGTVVVHEGR